MLRANLPTVGEVKYRIVSKLYVTIPIVSIHRLNLYVSIRSSRDCQGRLIERVFTTNSIDYMRLLILSLLYTMPQVLNKLLESEFILSVGSTGIKSMIQACRNCNVYSKAKNNSRALIHLQNCDGFKAKQSNSDIILSKRR